MNWHHLPRLSFAGVALISMQAAMAQDTTPADVAKGRRLFLQCAACHQVVDSPVEKIGPVLKGVVGRPVASVPGYDYSKALKALSFSWDEAQLDRWLRQPTQVAAGTTMAFAGLDNPDDRKAVIAYLKTVR